MTDFSPGYRPAQWDDGAFPDGMTHVLFAATEENGVLSVHSVWPSEEHARGAAEALVSNGLLIVAHVLRLTGTCRSRWPR